MKNIILILNSVVEWILSYSESFKINFRVIIITVTLKHIILAQSVGVKNMINYAIHNHKL